MELQWLSSHADTIDDVIVSYNLHVALNVQIPDDQTSAGNMLL